VGRFLAASLLAHVALVALMGRAPSRPRPPDPTPVAIAEVALPADPSPASGDPTAGGGPPAPADRRPSQVPRARSSLTPLASPDPFAIDGVSLPHGVAGAGPGPGPGVTEGPGVGGAGPPATAPAPRPRPDAAAIHAAVQRALRYPRVARERGLEGTVVVRFAIREGGSVAELEVVSSPDPLLGQAALDAVRAAAPFASPAGTIKLPVEFSLDAVP
jgi:protein TonB